jgi:hypothetical protein
VQTPKRLPSTRTQSNTKLNILRAGYTSSIATSHALLINSSKRDFKNNTEQLRCLKRDFQLSNNTDSNISPHQSNGIKSTTPDCSAVTRISWELQNVATTAHSEMHHSSTLVG